VTVVGGANFGDTQDLGGGRLPARSTSDLERFMKQKNPLTVGLFDAVEETATGQPDAEVGVRRSSEFARGTNIGRYVVLDRVGSGGMGVVYAAYDSDLDRKVALKFLHAGRVDRSGLPEMRLLREAQAMARLSHPNVVAVYEVGAFEEQVFLAMEFVDGTDLRGWLAQEARTKAEILQVFRGAGSGLAAAHAAGIIHRDFKPGNLLIDQGGRPRVTDFGISRAAPTDEDVKEEGTSPPPVGSLLDAPLTRTGTIHGTPAYMAPEQHGREPADARSDQFSFCVALYEALLGVHPFRGDSDAELVANLRSGEVRRPPPRGAVPRWCRTVLLRGLRSRPEERYPSMDALLSELERSPARRRRINLALVALAIAGLVLFGFALAGGPAEDRCSGGQAEFAAVWNGGVAARLQSAFATTGRSHAASSGGRVVARFDSYGRDWTAMHRSICQATARGEQSADLLDRRMVCLTRRLGQVGTLSDLFINQVDREVVDRAIDLVNGLDPVRACADSAALLQQIGPPADPDRRARVMALERQVDRADMERLAGRAKAAVEGAQAALEAEKALDYPPVAARAGRILGRALRDQGRPADAREALLAAQRAAQRAGDVKLTSYLLVELLTVVGTTEYRHQEGHLLAQLVEATLERPDLRDDLSLRADFLEALGNQANDEGRFGPAVEYLREVLAIRRRIVPPVPDNVASAQGNLARALSNAGFTAEARANHLEAIAAMERLLGSDHPKVALHHNNLGGSYMERDGNVVEARKHFLAAFAILEKMPDFKAYPSVLNNLGELEREVGNYDQARVYHDAALELRQRRLGPNHPVVAMTRLNIGNILRQTDHAEEALEQHRNALAALEKLGPQNPDHAECLSALGEDLRLLHRANEALHYQERALQALGREGKPLLVGNAQVFQGLALLDLGRRDQAIPLLEQGLKSIPPIGLVRAQASFGLARALEPRHPTSKRARQLAEEALSILTSMHRTRDREEVAAYLKARR
jgi:eukaryotic-like serine/threonine-protein kinase